MMKAESRGEVLFFGWTEDGRRVISAQPPARARAAVRKGPPLSPAWIAMHASLLAAAGFALGYAMEVLVP